MAVNLVTKFQPYVDEMFTTESKKSLLTNNDFDWTGAHTVKVHKVNTVPMTDYDRDGSGENSSRYGALGKVENTLEEFTLTKDRSFTFVIDKMDRDETGGVLSGASALARQQREVIIPEIDTYVYRKITENAGTKVTIEGEVNCANIYNEIIKGSGALDDEEVPETGRVLVVTPETYCIMKRAVEVIMDTDIGQDMRLKGVIGMIDGMSVIRVPKKRLPENFVFMIVHPVATVAPVKLEEYKVHQDPPGISGELVEGRIVYDAFVLDNKKKAIYYVESTPLE